MFAHKLLLINFMLISYKQCHLLSNNSIIIDNNNCYRPCGMQIVKTLHPPSKNQTRILIQVSQLVFVNRVNWHDTKQSNEECLKVTVPSLCETDFHLLTNLISHYIYTPPGVVLTIIMSHK